MPRPTPAPSMRTAPQPSAADTGDSSLRFSPRNLALLAAGLVDIIAGYALMAGGDTVVAPLLLVLGYAVLIPLGLIF